MCKIMLKHAKNVLKHANQQHANHVREMLNMLTSCHHHANHAISKANNMLEIY